MQLLATISAFFAGGWWYNLGVFGLAVAGLLVACFGLSFAWKQIRKTAEAASATKKATEETSSLVGRYVFLVNITNVIHLAKDLHEVATSHEAVSTSKLAFQLEGEASRIRESSLGPKLMEKSGWQQLISKIRSAKKVSHSITEKHDPKWDSLVVSVSRIHADLIGLASRAQKVEAENGGRRHA